MPDRPSRRTLLGSPLQVLKSAFGGRHSRSSGKPDPQHRRRSHSSRNHDVPGTHLSPSHTSRPTVTESSSSSPPARTLRPVRGERVLRATMSPSPSPPQPDMEESFIQADEGSHDNEDWISVPHEEEKPTQREFLPPVKSTSGKVPSALYSRLPTPVNPPTSDLYSHEIYQQKGRRSVRISIGKRYTGIRYQGEREGCLEGSHTISSQQHQRDGICDDSRPSEQTTTGLRAPLRTDKSRGSERVPLRRTNVLPTISNTSISRIHDSGNPRKSLPVMVAGRPSAQIYSRKEVTQDGTLKQASRIPSPSPSPISVIAADGHSSRSEEEGKAGEDWKPHARNSPQMRCEKGPPRRIRWTSKSEDLRAQDSDKEEKEVGRAATTQFRDDERERLTPRPQPNADAEPAPETRLRHRERTDRMVSSPRGQPSSSSSRIPAAVCRKKPILTVHTTGLSQVLEAQPREYWLGRFMTLTNAFHYEDSFQGPDVATGFGMLSSYSRPLGGSDGDLENYRIKRAFMVLENVCVTDEASASLRQFREEYVRLYGDQWMD
ncbi:hypothetical protein ASPCADRAFT_510137 [Aspergillus carbonarius ITEM 5010]|uniref:Uncharacterized protein n=1 Tax=Aspergillus carbonarius (strain ITEM 5010) TaxID=602072 RepID=A0A1R3R9Y0_ASPC5|nr:hypothetical protein ASPCADRAFT_510137 [Aspergillus carbonarius ITEM 5010]